MNAIRFGEHRSESQGKSRGQQIHSRLENEGGKRFSERCKSLSREIERFRPRRERREAARTRKKKENNAHGAYCRIVVVAVGKGGVIQAQKYHRTVDQTATKGGHVVEPGARKLYTPVDHSKWNVCTLFAPETANISDLLVLAKVQIERQESER